MLLNEMIVYQSNSIYRVFTEHGELKAEVYLPDNGQLIHDYKCMDMITKAIALRWGIIQPKKK